MNETLKHVAVFAVFLLAVLLLSLAEEPIRDFFGFKMGKAALLAVWATAVVIIFQLINHFIGQRPPAVVYGVAAGLLALTALLVKLGVAKW